MPADFLIRAAKTDDADAIERMAQALALHENASFPVFTAEDFRRDSSSFSMLIVECAGEAIGFAMYYPGYDLTSASKGFHLGDIYVDPDYRRRGVGTQLLAELARFAKTQERKWISLTALEKNHEAVEFYRKHGAILQDVQFLALGEAALKTLANSNKN